MSTAVSGVNGVSGLTQQASTLSGTTSGASLGKDEFMKLMLAQLRNQDPLNPVDSTQFVSQTAQFTSLEQLQNMNTTLTGLATEIGGYSQVASASALLGQRVAFNGSSVALDGTDSASLSYNLPAAAKSVLIQVLDASGNAVRTMKVGEQGKGAHEASFDGRSDNGTKLPAGTYTYQVAALDGAGSVLPGTYTGVGPVTAITNKGGTLMLQVGSEILPLSYVVGVFADTET